jgi:hypothetical protein
LYRPGVVAAFAPDWTTVELVDGGRYEFQIPMGQFLDGQTGEL